MSNNQSSESYLQVCKDLKGTIKHHRKMTYGGYIVFRLMQFIVPALSALLTGLISMQIAQNQGLTNTDTGKNQANIEQAETNKADAPKNGKNQDTGKTDQNKTDTGTTGENKANEEEKKAKIILTMSIILTVVGTLNSNLKPAESAEWAGKYSNKFEEFENDFNLSMIELGTRSDVTEADYIQLLRKTNHNLAKLIDERNLGEVALFRTESTRVVNEPEPVVTDGTE
jgi:hypothetical protein